MKLKVVKVLPEEIMCSFSKESEENELLNGYFFIEDFRLKNMNSCELFAKAFGQRHQMVKQVLPGQTFEDSEILEYELNEVISRYVANRLEFENEIFYAELPHDSMLYRVNGYYKLIEHMGQNAKFFKVGK